MVDIFHQNLRFFPLSIINKISIQDFETYVSEFITCHLSCCQADNNFLKSSSKDANFVTWYTELRLWCTVGTKFSQTKLQSNNYMYLTSENIQLDHSILFSDIRLRNINIIYTISFFFLIKCIVLNIQLHPIIIINL